MNQEMLRGYLGDRRIEVSLRINALSMRKRFVTGGFRETDKVAPQWVLLPFSLERPPAAWHSMPKVAARVCIAEMEQ
jgi:hypothetical protein